MMFGSAVLDVSARDYDQEIQYKSPRSSLSDINTRAVYTGKRWHE